MTKNLLTSALIAGLAAGILAALLQFTFVVPSLLEGELYETGARVHFADGVAQSERAAPALGDNLSRHLMTVAFDVVTYVGYGLILAGLMSLSVLRGTALTPRTGLIWGLSGFIAVQLAPAIGLPPELPGTVGADLVARQIWWFATVIATAGGLGLITFGRGLLPMAGVALIAAPQLIGAPQLQTYYGVAPPELAAHFATLSLGTAAAGWAVLGYLTALLLTRSQER